MSKKSYPIGSPEDFIINTLPDVSNKLKTFLDVVQSFLRDFQLDLEIVSTGAGDTKQLSDELQGKIKELQKEVLTSVSATGLLVEMVDEMKRQLLSR